MDMDAALWSQLPFEMVERVLSFVPVPNLCRYCSVCKRWNGLISNPNFAAVHAQNAAKREAAFIVMHYGRRFKHDTRPSGRTHKEWCILDLNTRRWYTVDDRCRYPFKDVVAMDGGLVCQMLSKTGIVVHNPIGSTAKELPTAPIHCTSKSFPKLNMVVDTISQDFKILLINHSFYNGDILRDRRMTLEERLKVLNDPIIRVYDSATNEWQGSTNLSCVTSSGVGLVGYNSKVEYQGLLYILLGSVIVPAEEQLPLWTYNLVEDAWENLPVNIPSGLRHPELIVGANRLFLVAWYSKRFCLRSDGSMNILADGDWGFLVSEIKISDMTRETLFELSKADMVALLDINSGVENVDSEHPKISVFGFGNSLMFMSSSSGNSVAFDVVTRKWDREWPQNPVGRLSDEHCSWVGKNMNLLLPSALW